MAEDQMFWEDAENEEAKPRNPDAGDSSDIERKQGHFLACGEVSECQNKTAEDEKHGDCGTTIEKVVTEGEVENVRIPVTDCESVSKENSERCDPTHAVQ